MTNLIIPSAGESITEVTILRWAKNDGDFVSKGDTVAELETDKANVDLPAPESGVLHPSKPAGQVAKVGEVVGQIDEGATAPKSTAGGGSNKLQAAQSQTATAPAKPAVAPAKAPASTEDLSPSVRRMVTENNVDPAKVAASGPGGRLLKEDVQKFMESPAKSASDNGQQIAKAPADAKPSTPQAPPTPMRVPPAAPPESTKPASSGGDALVFDDKGIARVAMTKIRKRIATNLVQAQHTAAILTTFNEIDLTAVSEIRGKYKEKFEKSYGVGLGFMSFFARAVILGLRQFPRVNAFLDGDDVLYHNYVNLGIAVSTERGLTVPVLHNADQMSFAKIELEIKRLATASRDGKLAMDELSGGTFTITNGGVFGSLLSTPILTPPQSGILGLHAIQKRPVVVNDQIQIRSMMYVALSYDHRLIDG
ncbi:MAG TPA: 2-oxoglutarate dehydrogenase complex dihydrolipoyllysine-residue succinyltransferase, partial [Humisphaera sp.]|nr:2-oxoglutarate dehydrogenase complex dihydrolipoyllysine-residue succinyltransferase [Humisphaera sp.]